MPSVGLVEVDASWLQLIANPHHTARSDMTLFQTEADVNAIFRPFLEEITADPALALEFIAASTSFKIRFSDPVATLLVDATRNPVEVQLGNAAARTDADVEVSMAADDGHMFWLGQLTLMGAVAQCKIEPKGEVAKLIGLLPTLQQAQGVYRKYAWDGGLPVS